MPPLLQPFRTFFRWYGSLQTRYPYRTQLCSTTTVYCIGDLSAQYIGGDDFDAARSTRSIIVGACISIPSYKWFLFLGKHFNYSIPGRSLAAKVAVNQLFYTPLFNVYYFAFHAALSGTGLDGAKDRVLDTVPTSVARSVLYWPIVTALNFTYVPPKSRAICTSIAAVFWQSYLSWLNAKASEARREKDIK